MSSEATPRTPPWRLLAGASFSLAAVVTVGTLYWQSQRAPAGGAAAPAAQGLPAGHPSTAGGAPGGAASAGAAAPHELGAAQMAEMVSRLTARLEQNPKDAEGWAMLARTHAVSGQHALAVPAFRKAAELKPDDAVLLADFADALAMTQQRKLSGEPLQLVLRALKVAPDNLKALSLAGTEAFNREDWAAAVRYWDKLTQLGGADNVFVRQVQGGLEEARQRGGSTAASAVKR